MYGFFLIGRWQVKRGSCAFGQTALWSERKDDSGQL